MSFFFINKRQKTQNEQSRMENPEKQVIMGRENSAKTNKAKHKDEIKNNTDNYKNEQY